MVAGGTTRLDPAAVAPSTHRKSSTPINNRPHPASSASQSAPITAANQIRHIPRAKARFYHFATFDSMVKLPKSKHPKTTPRNRGQPRIRKRPVRCKETMFTVIFQDSSKPEIPLGLKRRAFVFGDAATVCGGVCKGSPPYRLSATQRRGDGAAAVASNRQKYRGHRPACHQAPNEKTGHGSRRGSHGKKTTQERPRGGRDWCVPEKKGLYAMRRTPDRKPKPTN